jgi:hypothetical protein
MNDLFGHQGMTLCDSLNAIQAFGLINIARLGSVPDHNNNCCLSSGHLVRPILLMMRPTHIGGAFRQRRSVITSLQIAELGLGVCRPRSFASAQQPRQTGEYGQIPHRLDRIVDAISSVVHY